MEKTEVVATTPHSYCLSTDNPQEHKCDLAAKKVGELFEAEIQSIDIPIKWFASDTHRPIYDMNRKPSRETKYRTSVKDYVKEKVAESEGEVWNIDLHSFPDFYKDFEGHEVVLLVLRSEFSNPRTALLVEYLKVNDIDYGVYEGSYLNDIMLTTIAQGAYSLLIEINEKLSEERMKTVIEIIGRWIKEWDPSKYMMEDHPKI